MPRQDSLYEQLIDVQAQAVAMGCYEAADFLAQKISEIKVRQEGPAKNLERARPGEAEAPAV